jgi:hypothetical protein
MDQRRKFERLTREHPVDSRQKAAFIRARMELARADPLLDADARERTLADLQAMLDAVTIEDLPPQQ